MRALKGVALIAATVLCACAAVAAWRLAQLAATLDAQVAPAAEHASRALTALEDEMPRLQSSVDSAASSVGQAADAAQGIGAELRGELPPVVAQVDADLQETHRLILESGLTAMEARKASTEERAALPGLTAQANESLAQLGGELETLQSTTRDLDKLVSDPANARTLNNLSAGTASLAATAKDGQQFTHGLLHPSWPRKVWGVMLDVAHVFNPL